MSAASTTRSKDDSLNHVTHTTEGIKASHQYGQKGYLEGHALYTRADVKDDKGLTDFQIGGTGRVTAFGVQKVSLIGSFNFDNRNQGPSRMHPASDSFTSNLEARWQPAPDFRLHGSWNFYRGHLGYPDELAIIDFSTNPALTSPVLGDILNKALNVNRLAAGAAWGIVKDLDLTADYNNVS